MLHVPNAIPETIPVNEPTIATEVLELLHTPPEVAQYNVDVLPGAIVVMPVIAAGAALTVTDRKE